MRIYSINPKSGDRFSDELMDQKRNHIRKIRVPECFEYNKEKYTGTLGFLSVSRINPRRAHVGLA